MLLAMKEHKESHEKRQEKMISNKSHFLGLYLVLLILLGYFVVYPYFSPENINITEQVSIPKQVLTSKQVSIPKQVPTSKQLDHLNWFIYDQLNLINSEK